MNNNFIFVLYRAGTFGSFLSQCINFSPSAYNFPNRRFDIFDKSGAAHLHLPEFIRCFHNTMQLENWQYMPDAESLSYIETNCYANDSDKWYIQRCALPNIHEKLNKVLPAAQLVNISYTENDFPLIARNHSKKTLAGYILHLHMTDKEEYQRVKHIGEDAQLKLYQGVCLRLLVDNPIVRDVPYMFDFDFSWFYNKTKFINGYRELCSKLQIEQGDMDEISMLYENFCIVNDIKG
jgi:hypothetical protein